MGEIQPLRETMPSFVIDENATPYQREFLESFETRILSDPVLYMEAWGKYASIINPDRQRHQTISEIYGDSLAFLSENPDESGKRAQAQYDWHLYMSGKGVASALLGFDEATNAFIRSDPQFKNLQDRLSRSRGSDDRSAEKLRNEIRRTRVSLFIKRVIDIKNEIERSDQEPPATQDDIADGVA